MSHGIAGSKQFCLPYSYCARILVVMEDVTPINEKVEIGNLKLETSTLKSGIESQKPGNLAGGVHLRFSRGGGSGGVWTDLAVRVRQLR
jgi:hypothetical protein